MPHLPAFCDSCGNVFPSAFHLMGGVANLSNIVSTCPRCGANARIPDGIYEFVGKTLKVISASQSTTRELERLAEILRTARVSAKAANAVDTKIKTELPKLAALTKLLPKTTSDRINLFTAIIAVITLLKDCAPQSVTVQQVIEQTYVNASVNQQQASPAKPPVKTKKVGRNKPCPCGSGKKNKHCCGAPK